MPYYKRWPLWLKSFNLLAAHCCKHAQYVGGGKGKDSPPVLNAWFFFCIEMSRVIGHRSSTVISKPTATHCKYKQLVATVRNCTE